RSKRDWSSDVCSSDLNRPIKSEETLNKEANHESIENTEEALPANFYFFVENEDGTPFNNHQLIEQYVLSTEILQGAAEEVDFDRSEERRVGKSCHYTY